MAGKRYNGLLLADILERQINIAYTDPLFEFFLGYTQKLDSFYDEITKMAVEGICNFIYFLRGLLRETVSEILKNNSLSVTDNFVADNVQNS